MRIIVGSEGMGSWGRALIDYLIRLAFGDADIFWDNTLGPDLIVRSHYSKLESTLEQKAPYITWSAEGWPRAVSWRSYRPIMVVETQRAWWQTLHWLRGVPSFYLPYAAFYAGSRWHGIPRQETLPTTHLVGCCISADAPFRGAFVAALKAQLGDDMVNFAKGGGGVDVGQWFGDQRLIDAYRACRFVLAMENRAVDGYMTEKIINAYVAGRVPVVYGHERSFKKMFDTDSFVFVQEGMSADALAERLLAMEEAEYERRRQHPILRDPLSAGLFKFDLDRPHPVYLQMADVLKSKLG